MLHRSLADFLEELGHAGELARIDAEVDAKLEVAEITHRMAKAGGPALLFGSVAGHDIPVLTNLLGSEERIGRVLGGKTAAEVAARIAALLSPAEPEGWFERLKTAPATLGRGPTLPRSIRSGPCQQIVRLGRDVDLNRLPLLRSTPEEAAPAITAGAVFTASPATRRQVGGRYDLQLLGADRLGISWAAHDEHARLLVEYGRRAQPMPLAVVLGGDPAVLLAAAAPLPPETDSLALAGLLRESPLEVVACRNVELLVPAEADIVIEGYVDPAEPPAMAGPLCSPLGLYVPPRPAPVMHVTAITHRANPVYPGIVLGWPPHEGTLMDQSLARIFLPLARTAIPELVDYDLPAFGAVRHWAAISIHKTYPGQARRVTCAAWALRQFLFAKVLVVVDDEIDVHNSEQVLGAIAGNVDPSRDVFFQQGPPDPLDPAAPLGVLGHRMAIDATGKLPDEHPASRPRRVAMPEEMRRQVADRWLEYGLGPPP